MSEPDFHNGPSVPNRAVSLGMGMVFANVVIGILTEGGGFTMSETLSTNLAMLLAGMSQWAYSKYGGIGG
jgi:hypothetical protein